MKEQSSSVIGRATGKRKTRRNRHWNITWFNPPFSRLSTNIGWRFRTLVNKHFPKGSKLNKIFNWNTLNLSYSCMSNMSAVIRQWNSSIRKVRKIVSENYVGGKSCNQCRVKDNCPLNGKCQVQSLSPYCNLKCLYFVLSPLPPHASPSPSPVGTLEVDFFMSVEQPTINKCDYYY